MARIDEAVFKPTTGHYYIGPVGTAFPTTPLIPDDPWEEMGHTSIEDLLSISSEGGEATILGTLQSPSMRTSYSPRSETFAFTLQQLDDASLKLYFGSNMISVTGGLLGVPSAPVATQNAFTVIFEDGENYFGFYAPKAEILRGDDFSMPDTENFAGLPLAVKPLNYLTNAWAYAVTPLGA